MHYQGCADGLYFAVQRSAAKGFDHYGIVDIDNRRRALSMDGLHPVVLHQCPPGITADWLRDTGDWQLTHRIADEVAALERIRIALTDPVYAALRHNCKHFARWVAFGVRESKQLQAAGGIAGLSMLVIAAFNDEVQRLRSRRRPRRTRSARAA